MAEKTVSKENKEIAKYITEIVGIDRTVREYFDDNNENSINIFTCENPIDSEVKFYGTIGLSDYPNVVEMKDSRKNIPIELLILGYKKYESIPNILSTCAFYVLKDKWTCQPGSVFKNMVDFYYQKEMQHIIFVQPFLWENKLESLKLENKTVDWLLAVQISETELQFRLKNGSERLETLFEKNEINIFDLDRKSVI